MITFSRIGLICLPLLFALMVSFGLFYRTPVILYNPTESAPKGWYFLDRSPDIEVGDMVAAFLPEDAGLLASERNYLPPNIPVIKTVWAGAESEICVTDNVVHIDGKPPLVPLPFDSQERAMPVLPEGCKSISADHYFLVSERIETSFDSRYFGEVSRSLIVGKARLFWEVEE